MADIIISFLLKRTVNFIKSDKIGKIIKIVREKDIKDEQEFKADPMKKSKNSLRSSRKAWLLKVKVAFYHSYASEYIAHLFASTD